MRLISGYEWRVIEGGQLLKSSTEFPGDEVTTEYDYADIKAPL
jgi:hypothetical protein